MTHYARNEDDVEVDVVMKAVDKVTAALRTPARAQVTSVDDERDRQKAVVRSSCPLVYSVGYLLFLLFTFLHSLLFFSCCAVI